MDLLHIYMVDMPLLERIQLASIHNLPCFFRLLLRAVTSIVPCLPALETLNLAEILLHKAMTIAAAVAMDIVVAIAISMVAATSLPRVVVVVILVTIVVVLASTVIATILVVARTSTSISI